MINKTTNKLLCVLFSLLYPSIKTYHVIDYLLFLAELKKKSGTRFTIKYMKQVKLHFTRYISGKPLESNEIGVALYNGYPKCLM
jgi:hypothetical protein